jgi:arginine/lysine/ornithine decarboxylase
MPGHKGYAVGPGWEDAAALDFTELPAAGGLPGTGNLYGDEAGEGPIRAAEELYAKAYGAEDCLFLTGGATQGILALLAYVTDNGRGMGTVVADRGCHFSVHNALGLLDLSPVWVQAPVAEPFGVSGAMPVHTLEAALSAHPEAACAVVTSPTYYGVLSDIPALAAVCRGRGVPLLVDAAHGAHLPFLEGFSAPVAQGAAAAVLSAHKTLPALGQSAFLLTGAGIDADLLRRRAALFGSSSPSYLLMASLDLARAHMVGVGREQLQTVARWADRLRRNSPFFLRPDGYDMAIDPLRLCLYTGQGREDAARLARDWGVVCEMADDRNAVFLLSGLNGPADLARLETAVTALTAGRAAPPPLSLTPPSPLPEAVCTPRRALFAPHVRLPIGDCAGRVAGEPVGLYPPGVPLAARGEVIGPQAAAALAGAGVAFCEVLRGKTIP